MKLTAFRVRNFRSIIDTGTKNISPDNINVLIGQNESGKTSILSALQSFETGNITGDDLRSDDSYPEVSCSFEIAEDEFQDLFNEFGPPQKLWDEISKNNSAISLTRRWSLDLKSELILTDETISSLWNPAQPTENLPPDLPGDTTFIATPEEINQSMDPANKLTSRENFIDELFNYLPPFILFADNTSLLPRNIDVDDIQSKNKTVPGYLGAVNFLTIIGFDVSTINATTDKRIIEDKIDKLSKTFTADFQKYWGQKIGKNDKIAIQMELKHHDETAEEKKGKPYLTFYVRDNQGRQYADQRSLGIRWFVSFYLQFEAGAKEDYNRIFLIDEPGGSLHAKAQEDVLRVFEKIKSTLQIIYTTHSPYLIDMNNVHRILAVQRDDEDDENSPTKVFSVQELGGANCDTLFPLYTAMGVNLSHQQIIKRDNNILLEEISAYFYFKAFWKLFGIAKEAYFLPATGTSNIPMLANLMLGWGLNFLVVVDDESSGRRIYNQLKENLVVNPNDLFKIKGCDGIEDLFSAGDFKKYLLKNISKTYTGKNSQLIKAEMISKPIIASNFMLDVMNDKIKLNDLSPKTKSAIETLLNQLTARLK